MGWVSLSCVCVQNVQRINMCCLLWSNVLAVTAREYIHNPTPATGQDAWIMPEDGGADQGRGRSPEALITVTIGGHVTHHAPSRV